MKESVSIFSILNKTRKSIQRLYIRIHLTSDIDAVLLSLTLHLTEECILKDCPADYKTPPPQRSGSQN